MPKPRMEFDSSWKYILEIFFEEFVAFCLPEIHREIDWKKGYKTRDKELTKIAKNAKKGKRYVDKLIEVSMQSGKEAFVLLHIEIQGNRVSNFEERMFTYYYRLRDVYQKPVMSLAILADNT